MSVIDMAPWVDASPERHRYSPMHFQAGRRTSLADAEVVRGEETAARAAAPVDPPASALAIEAAPAAPSLAPTPTKSTARPRRARKRS